MYLSLVKMRRVILLLLLLTACTKELSVSDILMGNEDYHAFAGNGDVTIDQVSEITSENISYAIESQISYWELYDGLEVGKRYVLVLATNKERTEGRIAIINLDDNKMERYAHRKIKQLSMS